MTLKAIHGKPGSGKTCYLVFLLMKLLADWAKYGHDHGELYPRVLYTNVPLNIEAVNDYLTKELGFEVDITEQIVLLDDSFFRNENGDYKEWWEDFPEGAFIVIDEVHHYLPASMKRKKGGQDYSDKFTNYVSMHRHRQHDIILLSQHIDNVSVEVKKQIDTVYEVLNVKNRTIGIFPFTVQMTDIDAVREAWGFPVQMAHIKKGVCEARKVVYDKNYDVFILVPSLFALYRSHTKSDEALDRPSLKLGRIGSLIWFARRYCFKFIFSVFVIVSGVMIARSMFTTLPVALVNGLSSGLNADAKTQQNTDFSAQTVKPAPTSLEKKHHGDSPAVSVPAISDDAVSGFIVNGVITSKGVLRVGDKMRRNGAEEIIKRINFMDSRIDFESGNYYKR